MNNNFIMRYNGKENLILCVCVCEDHHKTCPLATKDTSVRARASESCGEANLVHVKHDGNLPGKAGLFQFSLQHTVSHKDCIIRAWAPCKYRQ